MRDSSDFYAALTEQSLAGGIDREAAERVIDDASLELLSLLQAAYEVRRTHFGLGVQVHVINNAANGHCPEDCSYCSQAKTSSVDIEKYPPKEAEEVLAEARRAYEAGAHRYCMVYAGRGPSRRRTEQLASMVRQIKQQYPIEVCVSAGLLDEGRAQLLKDAGLDRYNHNLNTAPDKYADICSTHTYEDRLSTLRAARKSGLEVCSGLIVGMGESTRDVVTVASELRDLGASSIPVNFLLPFDGTAIRVESNGAALEPTRCLRVLCAFRLMNPRSEVRIAAGREHHLRTLQPLALYPANSLFLDGYLNSRGGAARDTLQMIRDAGFNIVSDFNLEGLLEEQPAGLVPESALKSRRDLRPTAS